MHNFFMYCVQFLFKPKQNVPAQITLITPQLIMYAKKMEAMFEFKLTPFSLMPLFSLSFETGVWR